MLYQTDSGAGVLVLIALQQQQQLGSLVLLRVTPASTNDSNNSHLVDKPQVCAKSWSEEHYLTSEQPV